MRKLTKALHIFRQGLRWLFRFYVVCKKVLVDRTCFHAFFDLSFVLFLAFLDVGVLGEGSAVFVSYKGLDQLLGKFTFIPNALDLMTVFQRQNTFSMLDVFLKLTEVTCAVGIDFLSMLVANTILEAPNQLGSLVRQVASIPCDRGINKFSGVFVSIVKVHDAFTLHNSFLEVAFIDPTLIVEDPLAVEHAISELSGVF